MVGPYSGAAVETVLVDKLLRGGDDEEEEEAASRTLERSEAGRPEPQVACLDHTGSGAELAELGVGARGPCGE